MPAATTMAAKPLLMSSAHWHEPWYSACCGLDLDKFDLLKVDDSSADDFDIEGTVGELCSKLKANGAPFPVMTATDSMMIVHSMAKDALKDDERFKSMTGTSLCATVICDHKLLARALVPGCKTIKYKGVRTEDAVIPAIDGYSGDMILKPIAALGSVNVHKVRAGDESPFHGLKADNSGALHKATFLHVERFGAGVPDAKESIGLLEEYVPASVRKVSVDGAFVHGVLTPWLISDNIYCKDRPEVFEALEAPSSFTSEAEQKKIWEVFSEVASGLHKLSDGDFDCQFICIEMFVWDASRVDVMEVNIRVSANQLPLFHRLADNGCAFAAMIKMQQPDPKLESPTLNGTYGICLYRDAIPSAGPFQKFTKEKDGYDAQYYVRTGNVTQVYGYGSSTAEARMAAEKFYAKLEAGEETEPCSKRAKN